MLSSRNLLVVVGLICLLFSSCYPRGLSGERFLVPIMGIPR